MEKIKSRVDRLIAHKEAQVLDNVHVIIKYSDGRLYDQMQGRYVSESEYSGYQNGDDSCLIVLPDNGRERQPQ